MTGSPGARVALVTGAAGGIGRATVARLVADGCAVTAYDVDPAVGGLAGPGVRAVRGDVRDAAQLAGAVAVTLEEHGRLDVVVAAAAEIAGGARLWETTAEELDALWDVDVRGVWLTAAATVPAMLAGPDPGGCRFVALVSAAGARGLFGLSSYVIAKHAVAGLVRALAADLVGTGVTAAGVSPGATRTPMLERTAAIYGLDSVEELAHRQLLGRVLEPEEVAAAVAFCCSREGAVANGTVLQADGGFV